MGNETTVLFKIFLQSALMFEQQIIRLTTSTLPTMICIRSDIFWSTNIGNQTIQSSSILEMKVTFNGFAKIP
jgi:hypothetical protein